jgi:hypothetical protein
MHATYTYTQCCTTVHISSQVTLSTQKPHKTLTINKTFIFIVFRFFFYLHDQEFYFLVALSQEFYFLVALSLRRHRAAAILPFHCPAVASPTRSPPPSKIAKIRPNNNNNNHPIAAVPQRCTPPPKRSKRSPIIVPLYLNNISRLHHASHPTIPLHSVTASNNSNSTTK